MQLRRCAPILILFLCSLVASCGKSSASDAPKEGSAGLVQEVEGLVKATRAGQATRTLSKGDTIFVDDSLESGDGASAVILFAHNNATWQLSAGYTGAVVDSLPWLTKRHESSALVRAEQTQTAAAGRNSEREAAESIETMQPSAAMREEEDDESEGSESKPIDEAPSVVATVKPPPQGNSGRRRKVAPPKPKPKLVSPPLPSPGASAGTNPKGLAESAGLLGDDVSSGAQVGKAGYGTTSGEAHRADKSKGSGTADKPAKKAAAAAISDDVGDDDKEESRSTPASRSQVAKADTSSGAEVSRRRFLELVRTSGKACRSPRYGDGKVSIYLVVENSKLKKLEVKGPSNLGKFVKCMKSKLRKRRNNGSFSVRTSVTLSSQ